MIDTIKFLVPIEDVLALEKLSKTFTELKREDLENKRIEFALYTKKVNVGSYSKSITIRISNSNPLGVFIEFSIPKYKKGNNVEMIHASEIIEIMQEFHNELVSIIKIDIPHYSKWEIYRLDLCYNWIFKNIEEAKMILSFIRKIEHPRKKKYHYDTSVMYVGVAYTIKFYLKGPEYKKNDFKELVEKDRTEKPFKLLDVSNKILRFEIGIKKRHLKNVFNKDKVFISDICDDTKILEILNSYLNDKVFKYIDLKSKNNLTVEDILFSKFTKTKALRLFQFYRDYYLEDGPTKQQIINGGLSRQTIWRYKNELNEAGINFSSQEFNDSELLSELIIPSPKSKFDIGEDIANENKKCYD